MIYSKPCEYAIRAMAYMANQTSPAAAQGSTIAKEEGIPAPILGKVLQELARKGLLESRRGPGGGFRLARSPQLILLRDVVAAIDGLDQFLECAVGLERCEDDSACPLHDSWKGIRKQLMNYLETTTLADMAEAVARKKGLLQQHKGAVGA